MKNGICPKCNSQQVYRSFSESVLHAGLRTPDGVLMINVGQEPKSFFDSGFRFITLESYLCRACGYVELYVPDASSADLSRLDGATNWEKVNL